MSYRKKHIKNKIHKIKPKKSIFRKLWFWYAILFLTVILTGFYFFLFYSGLQLKYVVISGNNKVTTQDLRDVVSRYSTTGLINFWNIKINSKSIFLINDNEIYDKIISEYPDIENVKINKNLPQTLTLDITERNPVGDYCSINNQCFLIDNTGVIFEPTPLVQSNVFIVRQNIENTLIYPGEKIVSQSVMDSIYKIKKNLNDNFQIDVTEALIVSQLRLNVITNQNWKIYFDISSDYDIDSQLTKLDSLLGGGLSPASKKNLIYIDLRPKDRAIVCDNNTCGK